jgi:hypothetical protein
LKNAFSQTGPNQNPACGRPEYRSIKIAFLCHPRIVRFVSLALSTVVLAASFYFSGCMTSARIRSENAEVIDLTGRFSPVNPDISDPHFERHVHATRNGMRRDALILIAPVSIRATLQGVSGKVMLQGWATPVFNIGDGIQMNLFLIHAGTSRHIGSRYFDPGRNANDRNWIPIEVPLKLSEEDQLEIEISAGPQGNLTGDWLALSSLCLTKGKMEP